jgi:hypothetical protein
VIGLAALALDRERDRAVIVLTSTAADVDNAARALLVDPS